MNAKKLLVEGGKPLAGEVVVSGSKNAGLAILAATILAPGRYVISNLPIITDIRNMLDMLKSLGAAVELTGDGVATIDTQPINSWKASYELVKRMRASFYVAGALLARFGQAQVALPGGCVLGSRPVNFHLEGFEALGADILVEHGYVKAEAKRLQGTNIYLDPRYCSVGATVNITLAACAAKGTTIIENASREPEVVDFLNFLTAMGAEIDGIGTHLLKIKGGCQLNPCNYSVIPDRIEAATFLLAGAITGGNLLVREARYEHLEHFLAKLEATGQELSYNNSIKTITIKGKEHPKPVEDIITSPYPGFPTDLQPPMVALLSLGEGVSIVRETIYDSRFSYVDELRRMGADIKIIDQIAIIRGVKQLTGAPVEAFDIRAGAAMVLAGLAAKGITEISEPYHIFRGYQDIIKKLRNLGANIELI